MKGGYRTGAAGRRPIQIAAIRAGRYAPLLLATWIGSPAMATPAAFSVLLFPPCEWFLLLNSHLQNMLSGIPMLCGRTVALKQSSAPEPLLINVRKEIA